MLKSLSHSLITMGAILSAYIPSNLVIEKPIQKETTTYSIEFSGDVANKNAGYEELNYTLASGSTFTWKQQTGLYIQLANANNLTESTDSAIAWNIIFSINTAFKFPSMTSETSTGVAKKMTLDNPVTVYTNTASYQTYLTYAFSADINSYNLYWEGNNLIMQVNPSKIKIIKETLELHKLTDGTTYVTNTATTQDYIGITNSTFWWTLGDFSQLNNESGLTDDDKTGIKSMIGSNYYRNSRSEVDRSFFVTIRGTEYNEGYSAGYSDGQNHPTELSYLYSMVDVLHSALNIKVFGIVNIADLLGGAFVLLILVWIIGWFR